MSKLVGKWKLDRTEGFEEYMKALGVSVFIRKAALIFPNPTCEIQHPSKGHYIITMNVPIVMTHVQDFRIGTAFEDMIPNGENQSTVVSEESDTKLVFKEEGEGGDEPHVVTRELIKDEMVMTLEEGKYSLCTNFQTIMNYRHS